MPHPLQLSTSLSAIPTLHLLDTRNKGKNKRSPRCSHHNQKTLGLPQHGAAADHTGHDHDDPGCYQDVGGGRVQVGVEQADVVALVHQRPHSHRQHGSACQLRGRHHLENQILKLCGLFCKFLKRSFGSDGFLLQKPCLTCECRESSVFIRFQVLHIQAEGAFIIFWGNESKRIFYYISDIRDIEVIFGRVCERP